MKGDRYYIVSLDFVADRAERGALEKILREMGIPVGEFKCAQSRRDSGKYLFSIESTARQSATVEKHVANLWRRVDFDELVEHIKGNGYLAIGVFYYTATCTITLPPSVLQRLATSGINLEITCYPCE
jgi:hypothetical protein